MGLNGSCVLDFCVVCCRAVPILTTKERSRCSIRCIYEGGWVNFLRTQQYGITSQIFCRRECSSKSVPTWLLVVCRRLAQMRCPAVERYQETAELLCIRSRVGLCACNSTRVCALNDGVALLFLSVLNGDGWIRQVSVFLYVGNGSVVVLFPSTRSVEHHPCPRLLVLCVSNQIHSVPTNAKDHFSEVFEFCEKC